MFTPFSEETWPAFLAANPHFFSPGTSEADKLFNANPDFDPFPNWAEATVGSDPQDPNDYFRSRIEFVAGEGTYLWVSPFPENAEIRVYDAFRGLDHNLSVLLEDVDFDLLSDNVLERGARIADGNDFVDPRRYFAGARLRF